MGSCAETCLVVSKLREWRELLSEHDPEVGPVRVKWVPVVEISSEL